MQNEKIRLLYVDDEVNNLVSFDANFRRNFEIFTAQSAEEGQQLLKTQHVHIIITDQRMPEKTGVQFLESIIEEYPDPIRILLTGYADIETVIEAINKGQVYRYVTKPFDALELKATIQDAYNVYSFKKYNKELFERYKNVFSESSDAIFIVDNKGKLIDFNDASTDLLKYSRNQLNNIDYKQLLFDQQVDEAFLEEIKNTGVVINAEIKLADKNKNRVDSLISINSIKNQHNKIVGYQGVIKDITEQKKINNLFNRTIIESQETERNHFAYDLHNNISQQLTGIKFYIEALKKFNSTSDKNISDEIKEINKALNKVLIEIGSLCYKIMPRTIIDFGLTDSIYELCGNVKLKNDINFNIIIEEGYFPALDKTLEIILFRVIEQLIDNSVKHGKANKIELKLDYSNNKIILELFDNGIGFNLKNNVYEFKGNGLKNIKSWVESYDGEIHFRSLADSGMSCKILVPAVLR